jgi:hypothetical protein
MVARALGEVGTPEAMKVLASDMPRGSEGQSDYALRLLGGRAVPYDESLRSTAADTLLATGDPSVLDTLTCRQFRRFALFLQSGCAFG